ncbi:MAG: hypothetical protein ACFE94_12175 [Candidatus Hodarchaeota archaeon]
MKVQIDKLQQKNYQIFFWISDAFRDSANLSILFAVAAISYIEAVCSANLRLFV